ncbi:hypothetical protein AB5J56_41435 [Streptomyces sp. R21]|uniref:Uncharacterized protein n=1 Tax=Streptomyces sp. R21 TaxID=3238627 RepID=A0AB39PK89_9ACTN
MVTGGHPGSPLSGGAAETGHVLTVRERAEWEWERPHRAAVR